MTGAHLNTEAFANAYSEDIARLGFREREPGTYVAQFTARHPGVWIFRIAADSKQTHFTAILRSELRPGGAA